MADESGRDKVVQRYKSRGADLGAILGAIATLQEGEDFSFEGKVFVKDGDDLVSVYGGQMQLRYVNGDVFKNYRLTRQGCFSVPVSEVRSFVLMTEGEHKASPERRNYGPFLIADRRVAPGCVVIESVKDSIE